MSVIQEIGPLWSDCFNLAIEAMAAGSLGISTIVVLESGEILSRGRNQLFDKEESA